MKYGAEAKTRSIRGRRPEKERGNLPKIAIVEHFLAVVVQGPVVPLARIVIVARDLSLRISQKS